MDNSPFGRLPPEIRVAIYKEVLREDDGIMISNNDGYAAYYCYDDGPWPLVDAISLRGVCQLMREENSGLYFATNDVLIDPIVDRCATDDVWGSIADGIRPSALTHKDDLRTVCADVANRAHWFGNPVLKPRSIILNLGSADARSLDWELVAGAVNQFYWKVPVHLWVSVMRQMNENFFEDSWGFPNIAFKMGQRFHALQTMEHLLTWYHEELKHHRLEEVLDQDEFDEMIEGINDWLQQMPDR